MLDKSRMLSVDCIAYDLEDSVTPSKKAEARRLVRAALDLPSPAGVKERAVRINSVGSGLALADLTEVVSLHLQPTHSYISYTYIFNQSIVISQYLANGVSAQISQPLDAGSPQSRLCFRPHLHIGRDIPYALLGRADINTGSGGKRKVNNQSLANMHRHAPPVRPDLRRRRLRA